MSTQTTPTRSGGATTPPGRTRTTAHAPEERVSLLLDRKAVEAECGLKPSTVDCVFCHMTVVVLPDHRKAYPTVPRWALAPRGSVPTRRDSHERLVG